MNKNPNAATGEGNAPRVIVRKLGQDNPWLVGFDGSGKPFFSRSKNHAGIFDHKEISQSFSREEKRFLECIAV